MRISSKYNPVGGAADFWREFTRPNPYRWPILAASVLATGSLLYWLMGEKYFLPPEPPKVVFIKTFAANRTEAEIIASNIENQKRKEREAAEQAARNEKVTDIYRAIGRASGMDVEAIEAEAAAEKAREEAAEKARLERLTGGQAADGAVETHQH